MNQTIPVLLALTPFVLLIVCFLVFKLTALKASLYALIVELLIVFAYYGMSVPRAGEAVVWGNITMWTGFLVLYSGQIFGQAYRSTGLLQTMLDAVEAIVPSRDKEGRAIALVSVVGGFIGAFNGFASYPVTIPGLVELGFGGVQAITAYLVYFAWSVPFVSMFIAANISSTATHLPIAEIAQVSGMLCIPLVFISLAGFFKILGYRFFAKETQILFWLLGAANVCAIVLFTQVWPDYYILTLIVGSALSLLCLWVYGRVEKNGDARSAVAAVRPSPADAGLFAKPDLTFADRAKAFGPLVLGVIIVVATMVPVIARALTHLQFGVQAWGYGQIRINVFTSAGFFIFVTALSCYLLSSKKVSIANDFSSATKRSLGSMATLAIGSAMVYLMVDTQQIQILSHAVSNGGTLVYASLSPVLSFLGGMAFGQGLPGDFLFAQMQIPAAQALNIRLALLVGIVTVMTMGPPNPLKPTTITYAASLVNLKGHDGEIFRRVLPWQLAQLVVVVVCAVLLVLFPF